MMPPHPFTLRQLQYAVAVADTLSFRRAAERCRVAQPSLSAQLAGLEGALGVRLFERGGGRVLATAAGLALVERARRLLVEADDLQAAARQLGDPLAGALRLGVIPTISPYLLPAAAPRLRADFPRLEIRWTEDKTEALVERLAAGGLDGALLALEAEIGDLEREVIARDPFVLAAPVDHPLGLAPGTVAAADLRDAPILLLDEGHCFRTQALAYCDRTRAHELEYRATSLTTLVQMVAAGAGVTLLPSLAIATEGSRAAVRLRPFAVNPPHRTVALVWRRRSALDGTLRAVAGALRAAYPTPASIAVGRPARSSARRAGKTGVGSAPTERGAR